MVMVPFGPWHPDKGIYQTGAGEARNCIRTAEGYRPLAGLSDFNAGGIAGWPTLLTTVRSNDETMYVLAGDDAKLYRLNAATMAFDDVSKTGGYGTAMERWRGVLWGNELVMTNYNDEVQVADLGAGTPFEDLSADAPKARFIATCGPYLVLGDTIDVADGAVPYRLRWCGIEDIRAWVPDPETTADWQDTPDVGHLKGLTGGRQLTCLFEDGIVIGSLIGAPKAFRFDKVEGAQGCIVQNSVIQFRARTYYLSRAGFQMFDGQRSVPIGWKKVNRWFFDDVLFDKLSRMSVMVDQQQKLIVWLYCGRGSDGVTPNHAMLYNYDDNEFTWAEITAQLLGTFTTPGYNLDTIDGLAPGGAIDLMPAPLDDPFYIGGVPVAGAFVDNRLFTLAGNSMTAVLETPYQRLFPDRRSMLTEVREVIEGQGSVTCQPFTMNDAHVVREWPTVPRNSFGFCPVRAEGAFHKVRVTIGDQWKGAYAVNLTAKPLGSR